MSSHRLLDLVDKRDFRTLFIEELGWDNPDHPDVRHEVDGTTYTLTNIASFKGLRIWHCPQLPPRPVQRQIDVLVGQDTLERLVIFTSDTKQEWRWPRRSQLGAANAKLLTHPYIPGDPNYRTLAQRLEAIELDFDEDISLVTLLDRMRTEFDQEAETASAQAARLMGGLYTELEASGVDEHNATLLLARLLFLLFGDDAGMWTPAGLFETYLRNHTTSETLHTDLAELFDVLDTDENTRDLPADSPYRKFRYINGGLFKDPQNFPKLTPTFRELLLLACSFDWSVISPAIFGGMFQTVKSKEARREAGEHYTSETNILRTIGPLFLDDYRARLDKAKNSKRELTKLHNELGTLQYLDPACGCGNFLIITYREMRALELELLKLRRDLDLENPALGPAHRAQLTLDVSSELKVTLDQFHGFEISEWPARIAETAMLLVDHLANQQMAEEFGFSPDRLPIRIAAHIHQTNALTLDWASALPQTQGSTYVFGNPPFAGHKERTKQQTADMKKVWGSDYHGYMDFVTSWFKKSSDLLTERDGRFAFVATNSISQGEQVAPLFRYLRRAGWGILFAHRPFIWDSQAPGSAAVHCVIEGFARAENIETPRLFEYSKGTGCPVERQNISSINGYLLDAPALEVSPRTKPTAAVLPEVNSGSNVVDWGHLTIKNRSALNEVTKDKIASKYIRPFLGGRELINGIDRWILYLENVSPDDVRNSPTLRTRLDAVRRSRSDSPDPPTRKAAEWPHRFLANRQPDCSYLGIPQTFSENRDYATVARLPRDVIASMKLYTSKDPDGLVFGLISSAMFMAWQKTVGGRIKSDPSFSINLVWNTFPVPDLTVDERHNIISAGAAIVAAREVHPDRSLADAYQPSAMSKELLSAHRELDCIVDVAFGAPHILASEEQRLELLFQRYAASCSGSRDELL